MNEEAKAALRREFGYVPDESLGEKWVVYQGHSMIVIHPERRVRVYERGRGGDYHEIIPNLRYE